MPDLWFEDYSPGRVFVLGAVEASEAEIIEFGARFDPQPFHTDPASAAAAQFGGVIASGWHTCALVTRSMVAGYLSPEPSLASPAMDELRWLVPLRPGDVLTPTATVRYARLSASRPDRGIVRTAIAATNQQGATVISMLATNLIRVRPA